MDELNKDVKKIFQNIQVNDKHKSHNDMQKQIKLLKTKLDAIEVSAQDNWQRTVSQSLNIILEQQSHLLQEFDHLKKAIDLLTLELFKVQNKSNST